MGESRLPGMVTLVPLPKVNHDDGAPDQTPGQHLGPVPRGLGRSGNLLGVMDTGLIGCGEQKVATTPDFLVRHLCVRGWKINLTKIQ